MSLQPNFLIIGAARSGTTALASFLNQHPQVFVTSPKEPHFMAFAGEAMRFSGPGDDVTINRVAVTDPQAYQNLFAKAQGELALGEGSVSTLYYHQNAIENIQRYAPDAKLIAILRNPIERAFSSFMYMVARGFEPLTDFDQALEAEQQRIDYGWHHIWHYTRMGFYSSQIAAFQKAFGPDRLKVLLHEDLKQSPATVFADLFEFLGVDSDFVPETDQEINRAGQPKNHMLQAAIRWLGKSDAMKRMVRSIVPAQVRERIRSQNLSHPDMPETAQQTLTDRFSDEIRQLESLLGRDLSAWRA